MTIAPVLVKVHEGGQMAESGIEKPAGSKITLGWREWVRLPDLNLPAIKAKIDTGARTSSLHAHDIKRHKKNGKEFVEFKVFPIQNRSRPEIVCDAPVLDQRIVRSSNGEEEERIFISTHIDIGGLKWPIELTLSDRSDMKFRLLLGRTTLRSKTLIDVESSYMQGRISYKKLYKF